MSLGAGQAESFDSWHAHFSNLRERALKPPLLGIADGAYGPVITFEQVFSVEVGGAVPKSVKVPIELPFR